MRDTTIPYKVSNIFDSSTGSIVIALVDATAVIPILIIVMLISPNTAVSSDFSLLLI